MLFDFQTWESRRDATFHFNNQIKGEFLVVTEYREQMLRKKDDVVELNDEASEGLDEEGSENGENEDTNSGEGEKPEVC